MCKNNVYVWVVVPGYPCACQLWSSRSFHAHAQREQKLDTHHEEEAEVGQLSKKVLHADRVGVEGKIVADTLVELLHVLVHGGQFLVLLPGMFAEAVRGTELR